MDRLWDFLSIETRMEGDRIVATTGGLLGGILKPYVDQFYSVLNSLKKLPNPGDYAGSPYVARLDTDACSDCCACLDRCQMGALSPGAGHVELNVERCIGCGLCVTTCPEDALSLDLREDATTTDLPQTLRDTWLQISELQSEA